ncbi:MAG: DUF3089 domain-containing protein [Dehalococcoidia bacterium]
MRKVICPFLLTVILLCIPLTACKNTAPATNAVPASTATVDVDYSKPGNWLELPSAIDKKVDVFFLIPTAWKNSDPNPTICAIDEPSLKSEAPFYIATYASAFATVANIYAPYYRQDNLSPVDRLKVIAGIPTIDAISAFDYYIKHYNNGRPFILAGHSQGSDVLTNLLSIYMKDHPEVLKNMVAAYVIGFPVTTVYLAENPFLKFARGPDDTGVIVSYNTQAPDVAPGTNPVLSGLVGEVINPITWTRDETLATTSQGLGSYMPDPVTLKYSRVPQYADARIDQAQGVLICTTADEDALYKLAPNLGRGVYHAFDYSFYYYNLRENAANRIDKFLKIIIPGDK